MPENTRLADFANMVKQMRTLQKEFFLKGKVMSQYERASLVHRAKKLEGEVDAEVERILNPKPEQRELFS